MKFKQLILATCAAVTMYAVPASAIELTIGTDSEDPNFPSNNSNLLVTNGNLYSAASGYKHPMTLQSSGPFEGLYQAAELVFTVLGFGQGGPTLGSFIAIGADNRFTAPYSISVAGPDGATFKLWDTDGEVLASVASGSADFSEIWLTEGSEPTDTTSFSPAGSVKGRNFTVDKEGVYTISFHFADLSVTGDGAGPHHAPTLFTMTFEAVGAPIPEPSTFALLGLAGLAGGAAIVRNRRNKA